MPLCRLRGDDRGHAVGRIGCFLQGCCGGRAPGSFGLLSHPVELYEAAGLAAIVFAGWAALGRVETGLWSKGGAFRLYLGLYGALRLWLDIFRGDGRPERFLGFSHQQGIALACIAAAILPMFMRRRRLVR